MFTDSVENSVSWNASSLNKSHSDFSQYIIYLDLALTFILVSWMFHLVFTREHIPIAG